MTLARILRVGIPITLGASVMSIITLLDTKLVNIRLLSSGLDIATADTLYGSYSVMMTLFNLPAAFITPLTISIVPAISAAVAIRNRVEAGEIAESSLRICSVIALPMGVGLSVLASPIVHVLYKDTHEIGPTLLCLLGIASFFVCIALLTNAILQASGYEHYPMLSMIVGGGAKLAINWVLVGNPDINIIGAPVGTIVCYLIMCVMNLYFLRRSMKRPPRLSMVFLRPFVCSAVMGLCAWAVYGLMSRFLGGGSEPEGLMLLVSMLASVGAAVVVYLVLSIALRSITYADMKLIPKGEKLARLLHIR